jgi:hypothetical protein
MSAASPTFWRVSTQAEFLAGEVDMLSVDAEGHLLLGPGIDVFFDTTSPALWSLTRATDGALWMGSGNDGRLYRVDQDGTGQVVFDADELDIHAVVADDVGGVFAATSPNGRIYRVTPDGETLTVFDPDDTYIWGLAVAPDGALYAATGNNARIYRIEPGDSTSAVFFQSEATHVLSLAFDSAGRLLAGTESPGQVLRIDQDGRAFVLLDTVYEEVRALHSQPNGSVLAIALNGQNTPATAASAETESNSGRVLTPVVSVTTSVTTMVMSNPVTATRVPAITSEGSENGGQKGAVYRIAEDGLWDELWSSSDDTPYDAVFDADGGLVIGTGDNGKIFRVSDNPPHTVLLSQAPAKQVTRFLTTADGALQYGTANPGKIVRLNRAPANRGTYESSVRDAQTVSTWGTISWRAQTPGESRIEFASRSGNTAIPDGTWSDWSIPYADSAGTQIASPNARYLQWRAALIAGNDSPTLTSVTAAYLPRNLRPTITQITVHPPGLVFQQAFNSGDPPIAGLDETNTATTSTKGTTTLGRQSYRKGIQTLVWQASDGNGDQLEYSVAYRREGATDWVPLQSHDPATVFAWDTSSVPDGSYRVRITVSDVRANAPDDALIGEQQSQVFGIDNSSPRVEVSVPRRDGNLSVLPFTVRDDQSPIQRVEISKGANRWRVVYPMDGIPDGLVEQFEVVLEVGDSALIIRATDILENTVTVSGTPPGGR